MGGKRFCIETNLRLGTTDRKIWFLVKKLAKLGHVE